MAVTRDDIWLFIFYQQSILIPPEDKSFFFPLSLMGLEHFKAVVLVILGNVKTAVMISSSPHFK